MASPLLQCTCCRAWLTEGAFNRGELAPCPTCVTPLQVEVFPAFFRPATVARPAERVMIEGEASCFYHPQKKAVLPCAACGRFLCALCDCQLQDQHFCPACLEAGRKKGRIKTLENERTLYDQIALALAVFPIITIYFTVITAPMALYVALRHWHSPRSIVHPGRWRFVLAILVAALQIVGWAVVVYLIIQSFRSHG